MRHFVHESILGQPEQVMAIVPAQFLNVENGAAFVQVTELEFGDHFIESENLLARGRRPAQQRNVVKKRFRQESLLAI